MFTPGDWVGPFELNSCVARGRRGKVWRARAPSGRCVAIKIWHDPTDDAILRTAAACCLDIPGLARVLGLNTIGPVTYLVSEFAEGESLQHRLDRAGRLSPIDTVRILNRLLRTLESVHRAGFLHGRLALTNVLLETDGQVKLTGVGQCGLARGGFDVDLRAIGVMLFQLLTDREPERGDWIRLRPKFSELEANFNLLHRWLCNPTVTGPGTAGEARRSLQLALRGRLLVRTRRRGSWWTRRLRLHAALKRL